MWLFFGYLSSSLECKSCEVRSHACLVLTMACTALSTESGTHLFNYMLTIWWMNKWMNVNFLPKKNLQGLPFQTWAHFHSSAWHSSTCPTTGFFSFSLLHLNSLSDKIPFISSSFIKFWVLPHPGSFPVPTVQVFLELLLGITHFVLNHSPTPLQPRLSSS